MKPEKVTRGGKPVKEPEEVAFYRKFKDKNPAQFIKMVSELEREGKPPEGDAEMDADLVAFEVRVLEFGGVGGEDASRRWRGRD